MASGKRHGQERAEVIYTNLCCLVTYKHSLTCVCNDTQLRNYIEITSSYLWLRFFGSPNKEKRKMAVIYAEIAFVNKKGETKRVRFPMEKESYKAYHHPSVPKEWTDRMMLEEYRAYCKERNYRKRVVPMPVDFHGYEIEIEDKENLTPVEYVMLMEEAERRESMMERILSKLTPLQREAVKKVCLEGKSIRKAASEAGISSPAMLKRLRKAKRNMERIIESGEF